MDQTGSYLEDCGNLHIFEYGNNCVNFNSLIRGTITHLVAKRILWARMDKLIFTNLGKYVWYTSQGVNKDTEDCIWDNNAIFLALKIRKRKTISLYIWLRLDEHGNRCGRLLNGQLIILNKWSGAEIGRQLFYIPCLFAMSRYWHGNFLKLKNGEQVTRWTVLKTYPWNHFAVIISAFLEKVLLVCNKRIQY